MNRERLIHGNGYPADATDWTAAQASPENQTAGKGERELVHLLDHQMIEMARIADKSRNESSELA